MFSSLLSRSEYAPRRRPRRLSVEVLEQRDCPTVFSGGLTLEAMVMPDHIVQMNGSVIGDFTPGESVHFSGAVAGQSTINEAGQFQYTTTLAYLGDATVTLGGENVTSSATTTINTPAPNISLYIADSTDTAVTYCGVLSGLDFAGQSINVCGGLQTVVTDIQGHFSFTLPREGLGMVWVSATDLWGQSSNVAQLEAPNRPMIDFFEVEYVETENCFRFFGHVTASNLENLVITFSGVMTGSVSVDTNGNFSYTVTIPSGTTGIVYAQTTQNELTSNLAQVILSTGN